MDGFSELFSTCRYVCAVVGTLYLVYICFSLLWNLGSGIYTYFLAPLLPWGRVDLKSFGSWAVVTGASKGIGKGYALALAKKGLNIVLLSRSKEKMEKVAKEIRETHLRETLVIPVDFAQGQSVYPRLYEQLKDLDIGILVNNVGLSTRYPQYLLEISEQRLRDIIELNCQVMVQMTHLLLPAMVEKGRGAVINISSYISYHPQALIGVYSSTKRFVNTFTSALSSEYSSKGILIQTVMPHLVSTAMTKLSRNIFVPSGTTYAKSAVSTIGVQKSTYGYWPHAFHCSPSTMIPKFIVTQYQHAILLYARYLYKKHLAQQKS